MQVRLLRDFRGISQGHVLDVAPAIAEVWRAEGIAEPAEPTDSHTTDDEETLFMKIRFLIPIDGPIGTYDAGDEIEVVDHFAEAWIEAGIAEDPNAPPEEEAEVSDLQSASVKPPRTAAKPPAKPRGSGQPPTSTPPAPPVPPDPKSESGDGENGSGDGEKPQA